MRIAIIGSGVSGLAAAWLLGRSHHVEVFERDRRPGGHAHTHRVRRADGAFALDTGFMVYNERTYPNFIRLLAQLGVASRVSDMSFSVRCHRCGLEFSSRGLRGLYAQPRRLADVSHYLMLRDVLRFFSRSKRWLAGAPDLSATLDDFLAWGGYGEAFVRHFLLPMGGAIWSASGADMRAFPAHAFLRFFDNHGLLAVDDAPVWRTVVGGSRTYVDAIVARSGATFHIGREATGVRRTATGVEVGVIDGSVPFDHVIIATHANDALALLVDPTPAERDALGAIRYSSNRTVLHTDESALPRRAEARASWNCELVDCRDERAPAALTYDISRLQGIQSATRFLVSLNRALPIDGEVLATMDYTHPVMDGAAFAAQAKVAGLNGTRNTWFCGAHLRNGFHEDGVVSALRVAERFGARL